MDYDVLKIVAQVAGIGGVGIGAATFVFRDILRREIFPQLTKADAYRVIRLISVLVWSIAIAGILAWVWLNGKIDAETHGDASPIVKNVKGDVDLRIGN
jgi:hypothetical protein